MDPIKSIIYGTGVTIFIVVLAKLFTKEELVIDRLDAVFDKRMIITILIMTILFLITTIVILYSLITFANVDRKYPTFVSWIKFCCPPSITANP